VVKIHSLQDLKQVRTQLAEQARLAAQAEPASARVPSGACRPSRTCSSARPGRCSHCATARGWRWRPTSRRPFRCSSNWTSSARCRKSISDEFDASTLLDVDDAMSFRRPGIGTDVTRKLRRGDWSIQREIDLHGLRREDARDALSVFVRESHKHGCAACGWCMARGWARRARRRCSRAGYKAG
jgi:hypothetical protein